MSKNFWNICNKKDLHKIIKMNYKILNDISCFEKDKYLIKIIVDNNESDCKVTSLNIIKK